MIKDYGVDDMGWLLEQSDRADTITVDAHGRRYHLPIGRFDNRIDRTSFVRDEQETWASQDVKRLHSGLAEAFDHLYGAWPR